MERNREREGIISKSYPVRDPFVIFPFSLDERGAKRSRSF